MHARSDLTSFDAVCNAVAEVFGESPDSIRSRSPRPARKAIAQLAWRESGLNYRQIGDWLGVTAEAAGYLSRRGEALERSDEHYASRLRTIRLRPGIDRAPF